MKVIAMNIPESSSIATIGCAASLATNCGRKAKKKIESFGLRRLMSTASSVTPRADFAPISRERLKAPRSRHTIQAM